MEPNKLALYLGRYKCLKWAKEPWALLTNQGLTNQGGDKFRPKHLPKALWVYLAGNGFTNGEGVGKRIIFTTLLSYLHEAAGS